MRDGLAPYSAEDFYYVVDKTSRAKDRLILVGGQALEVWGTLLDVPAPATENALSFQALTVDADWLGNKEDATWLAELLGTDRTELQIPDPSDPTPNTALLYLASNGRVMLMDFLAYITGLKNQAIKDKAADLQLTAPDGKTLCLRVLDPIHCLASRMANLKTHPEKREGNGPIQAQWAIDIVRAYLLNLVSSEVDAKAVRGQCQRVAELAEYGPAEYCYTHFRLDPLQSVESTVVTAGGQGFATEDWPRKMKRIQQKREKWDRKARQAKNSRERPPAAT